MFMMRLVRWPVTLLAFLSLVLLGQALRGAPVEWTLDTVVPGTAGDVGIGFQVGIVQAVLLLLVAGMGTVVTFYSARNLAGQPRLTRYALLEVLVIGSLAVSVTTTSLPLLAAAWTTASLAMAALVGHAGTRSSRKAASQVRSRLLLGDLLLWAAVLVIGFALGTWTLTDLPAAVAGADIAAVTVAALLVGAAGVVRSALVPAHRWLPETAEAPSPVSALLHAGLVNGVGILALLMWPLIVGAGPARVGLVVVGAATALIATGIMRARADLKGRLAASTSSQMGYLAIQVGLGLPVAALLHVVGHGAWKAAQFLGAGDAVARAQRRGAETPTPLTAPLVVGTGLAAAILVATAALVPLASWPALHAPAELLPLAVAVGVCWLGLVTVLRSALPSVARILAAAVLAIGALGYVLVLRGAGHLLEPVFGVPAPWSSTEGVATAFAVLALLILGGVGAWVDHRARSGRLPRLARWVGRAALSPRSLPARLARRPVASQALLPVADADTELARGHVAVGVMNIGALYPLTSFVASNPLSGLEDLGFRDAGAIAHGLWGVRSGPSAADLRRALDTGAVTDADVDAVLRQELGDAESRAAAGQEESLIGLTRRLMLQDPPTPERCEQVRAMVSGTTVPSVRVVRTALEAVAAPEAWWTRVDDLAHHCCARTLAGAAWPGAVGPWQELREMAPVLDREWGVRGVGAIIEALPADAAQATACLMEHLALAPADRPAFIAHLLARQPGWPAHLRWRERHAALGVAAGLEPDPGPDPGVLLEEVVATRLALDIITADALAPSLLGRTLSREDLVSMEAPDDLPELVAGALGEGAGQRVPQADLTMLAASLTPLASGRLAHLRAAVFEHAYERDLLGRIGTQSATTPQGSTEVRATSGVTGQVVTCIDVRSERFRRHLEQTGPWETFGAAGFFGIPVRYESATGTVSERSPALLRPGIAARDLAVRPQGFEGVADALGRSVRSIESAPGLVFSWVEAFGWLLAPTLLVRTLWPRGWGRLGRWATGRLALPSTGDLDLDVTAPDVVGAAAAFLTSTGLREFAPVVVLCGHGATVTNNPHAAAYDCGACGGAAGDVSARALALTLNDPSVRRLLRADGIDIPAATVFVPAVHDTTTDTVRVLDDPGTRSADPDILAQLGRDAARAGRDVRQERVVLLPDRTSRGPVTLAEVESRAADWAQPRPEWGLAGAAAIVVGPRELTRGLDLGGRVFLQSYRQDLDPDGSALRQLLAAPVVVAQWITSQYWSSLNDPDRFGAGDKTTHNVIGDGQRLSAVLTGARGDLRIGLPWQSVSAVAPQHGDSAAGPWAQSTAHAPQRLLVVLHASPERVEAAITAVPEFGRLVLGGWILLRAVDPDTGDVVAREDDGRWAAVRAGRVPADAGRR